MACSKVLFIIRVLSLINALLAYKMPQSLVSQIEQYNQELQSSTLQVLADDSAEDMQLDLPVYADRGPVPFDMPSNFMHSFRPNTGVGNREDLVIDKVVGVPLFHDGQFSKWRYARFNNSDYVLAIAETDVALWKKSLNVSEFLDLSVHDSIFRYASDASGSVSDAFMFVRKIRNTDALHIAILTTGHTDVINLFEVVDDKGEMVTVINLGFRTFDVQPSSILGYLESRHVGILAVLVTTSGGEGLVYRKKSSSELNHYIELHFPAAVDMVTFSVGGHAYVAVANRTECVVYKMDEFAQIHIEFDRMYFEEAIVDLEHFRLGFQRYLVISSTNYQALYVLRTGGFHRVQDFKSTNVYQAFGLLLPNCRDDVILMFIKREDPDLFVWSGQKLKFIPVSRGQTEAFLPLAGSVTSFSYGSYGYALFKSVYGSSEIMALETHLNSVPDPVLEAGAEVEDFMRQLENTIQDQEKAIDSMSAILENAVKPFEDQVFAAPQTFRELHVIGETLAHVPVNESTIRWEGASITLGEYLAGNDDLEQRISELESQLDILEHILQDAVLVDQDAVITGRKTFLGHVFGSSVDAQSLSVKMVGGVNLPELQKQIYRLDKPTTILGTLSFEYPLTIMGGLEVYGTVNGIDISRDVMTTDTNQTSNAEMTFHNKVIVSGDLSLSGRVNGIDIGTEVVTLAGEHVISGKKTFAQGIIAETVFANFIDGVDMDRFFNKALTISGDQSITGTKHFTGTLHTQNIHLLGTLNGYEVNTLANSVVRRDVPAEIVGHITFHDDVVIQNSLTVVGTLNGLRIPDDLFQPSKNNIVTARKIFTGTITANEVFVKGTVNGISLPADIITLSGDESINSTFYFNDGITVNGNIVVHGLVDDVDISELERKALKIEDIPFIENIVFKGPVHISGNLDVSGKINGVDFNALVNDVVYRDEQDVFIQAPKTFTELSVGEVNLQGKINGYNILTDFISIHGSQTIQGTTVFKKPVTFQDISVANGMVGGVNIEQLYKNRIALSIDQESKGNFEFVDSLTVDNLIVRGTIGGMSFPQDFVLRSSEQSISNKVFHHRVQVHQMHVAGHISVTDTFGGVQLSDFIEQRVTLSTDQDISGDLLLGNTTAYQVDVYGLVNGVDINKFADNVMSLTKEQYITAYKDFSGVTTVHGGMTTSQGINGINLADVNNRAFKLHGEVVVEAPMMFANPVTFTDLQISGLINGINITQLNEDSVKNVGEQHIFGPTVFHKGFNVNGDISATTVNGLYLPRDILTKHSEQTITGNYGFNHTVIHGNLLVDGLVNGIDLSETVPNLARIDENNVIHSNVIFTSPITVIGNLDVAGLVNGVDLQQLQDSVLKTSGDQSVPGNKILRGNVTVHGDVDVEFVNGVNWAYFVDDVVRTDIPQFITGKKTFVDDIEVNGDIYVSGMANIAKVNGVDLAQFQREVVFIDRPANITGTKVFTSSIEITGDMNAELINNLRLKTDVVTLQCGDKDPQVITGMKTFQSLLVHGDIFVEESVNGFVLHELEANTLSIDGYQVITGEKTFHKPVTFSKNLYTSTVNGMVLHKELVTLDTDQNITGGLTFQGNVHVNQNLHVLGLLNGIDLVSLANNALYVDNEQVITGFYDIEHAKAVSQVLVEDTVNGLQLSKFAKTVNNFWAQKKGDLAALRVNVEQQCEIVRELHHQLENSYYVLDGFLYHQTLSSSADFIEADPFGRGVTLSKVLKIRKTAESARYQWQESDSKFVLHSKSEVTQLKHKGFTLNSHVIAIHIGVPLELEDSVIIINGVPVSTIPKGFSDADAIIHGKNALVAVLYLDRNLCEVFEINGGDEISVASSGVLKIDGATSVALFEMSDIAYLAVSCDFTPNFVQGSSKIYARMHGQWQLVQNVLASASLKVTHFGFRGYHYLAFSNAVPVYESREPQAIQVYRNTDRPDGMKFVLFQKIPFDNARVVEVFEFGGLPELYLIAGNKTRIQVFTLEGEAGFKTNYTIPGKCVTDVKPIVLDNDLYLTVGQNDRECAPAQPSVIYKGLTKGSIVPRRELMSCS